MINDKIKKMVVFTPELFVAFASSLFYVLLMLEVCLYKVKSTELKGLQPCSIWMPFP